MIKAKVSIADELLQTLHHKRRPKLSIKQMSRVFEQITAGKRLAAIANNYCVSIEQLETCIDSVKKNGFAAWD